MGFVRAGIAVGQHDSVDARDFLRIWIPISSDILNSDCLVFALLCY